MVVDSLLLERFERIHDRISRACEQAARPVGSVTLIAVTKTQPVELVQALINLGINHIGENRVAEILDKAPHLTGNFTMHMIGHLQTNKIARVLPHVRMIQSIDRVRVIEYIERYLPPEVKLPVLVEVNTSGEATKEGCAPDTCPSIVERIITGGRLRAAGYMTVGPLGADEQKTRGAFSLLRGVAEKCRDLVHEPHLSMGMSADFEWAISEGATMVRIGTLLTGERA